MKNARSSKRANARKRMSHPETGPRLHSYRVPSREDVARRAYEISLSRGDELSDPVGDWLQAERELRQALAAR